MVSVAINIRMVICCGEGGCVYPFVVLEGIALRFYLWS